MSIRDKVLLEIEELRHEAEMLVQKAEKLEESLEHIPHDISMLPSEEWAKFQQWFEKVV
jgi:hypothetical protein